MSYDVRLKAKLEGCDSWVHVGDGWINHTSNTSEMIKEVCGSRPSAWDGKRSADILPILKQGVERLKTHEEEYRCFQPENGWGTVETTIDFLSQIISNCEKYPTAIIEVDY